MLEKDKLYYLLSEYKKGNYDIITFCEQFTKIYDLELDYSSITNLEYTLFHDLAIMTARFSQYEEDLMVPNVYFSANQINEKINEVAEQLSIQ